MATIRFNPKSPGSAGAQIQRELLARLRAAPVGVRLVAQAKDRIRNSGDSEVTYPDLWASSYEGGSFRAGGTPLRDTGGIYASLDFETKAVTNGQRWALTSPLKHAIFQHFGFETKGPNFIPLTKKARRNWTKLRPLKRAYSEAVRRRDWVGARRIEKELEQTHGLVEGETYIMAWGGVKVPPRPIFNLPPENRAEIKATIRRSLKRRRAS